MYHEPMEAIDPMALLAQVAMGITLAACAGLRAFLPPLALGVASRGGLIELPREFSWLGSTPALTVLTIAVLVELLGDKVPVVDHFLDAAGTVLRPAAGALSGAVPLVALVTGASSGRPDVAGAWIAGIAGAVMGGIVSTGVHLAKSHVRLGSSLLTAGIANPVISLAEDAAGIMGVVLALLLPLAALALLVTAAVWMALALRRRRRMAPRRA